MTQPPKLDFLKTLFHIFFAMSFVWMVQTASADTTLVVQDVQSELNERRFDKKKIDAIKIDPDYAYEVEKKIEEASWFDKLMYKIMPYIIDLFNSPNSTGQKTVSYVFYFICFVLVVLLLVVLGKMTGTGIFSRGGGKGSEGMEFEETLEDIHGMDFDALILEASQKGLYRRAVRLYYLKALKLLSEKSQIVWEINKTNREYLLELKSPSLRSGFEDITFVYEYVWYGNSDVDAATFSKLSESFDQFTKQATLVR